MGRIGVAAIVIVALLGACGKQEPPAPQATSSSDERVKNADKLMLPAREGAKTMNAADKVGDVYKAQKEATDKQVEESTK